MQQLLGIMRALRDSNTGCPWNREQTLQSLRAYIIEEAYEVAAAIEQNDSAAIVDELGDLLLQVIFCAQIGSEQGEFDFEKICKQLAEKLTQRHPHVFADEHCADAKAVSEAWEQRKGKAALSDSGFLQSYKLPKQMPQLMRAQKLQKRAASVGFDWQNALLVYDKLQEEAQELHVELQNGNHQAAREELGDLLFVLASMARHLDVDAEQICADSNQKFIRRFDALQQILNAQNIDLPTATADDFERAWQQVKQEE